MNTFKPNQIFFSKWHKKKTSKVNSILFFAADEKYFNFYGKRLIKSLFYYNNAWGVHVHLYNPSKKTLLWLLQFNFLTYSYEILEDAYFEKVSLEFIKSRDLSRQHSTFLTLKAHYRSSFSRILAALIYILPYCVFLAPKKLLIKHFKIVYFACQRFVALNYLHKKNLFTNKNILSLDADSVINKKLPSFKKYKNIDLAIYKRPNGIQAFLAGVIWLPYNADRELFLGKLASTIQENFSLYKLDWGLDQILLHKIVPQYRWASLEPKLRCFDFLEDSIIWLAKGITKNSRKFLKQKLH